MAVSRLRTRRGAGLLAALALAGCGGGATERPLPDAAAGANVFGVTNEASGPIVVAGRDGAAVSTDGGRSWHAGPADLIGARSVAFGRTMALFSLGRERVETDLDLRTVRARGPWPFRGSVALTGASADAERFWAVVEGGDGRLQYSNDAGASWWPLPAAGLCKRPLALAVASRPQLLDRIYVACGTDGLQISDDLGASFRPLQGVQRADDVATTPADPRTVAIAGPAVRVSTDGGLTWRRNGLAARRVAVDPRNPKLVLAITLPGRLAVSTDGGVTFGR